MPWEADAVSFRATRCIISAPGRERATVSAVQCFDASEGTTFSAG
jgi:hypothetical protein